jgi:hypothetical protein
MMQDAPVTIEQLLVKQIAFAERHNKVLERHYLTGLSLRFDQHRFVDLLALLLFGGISVGLLLL